MFQFLAVSPLPAHSNLFNSIFCRWAQAVMFRYACWTLKIKVVLGWSGAWYWHMRMGAVLELLLTLTCRDLMIQRFGWNLSLLLYSWVRKYLYRERRVLIKADKWQAVKQCEVFFLENEKRVFKLFL